MGRRQLFSHLMRRVSRRTFRSVAWECRWRRRGFRSSSSMAPPLAPATLCRRFSVGSIQLPTLAKVNVNFMSDEFLWQFKNPTLYLKVSCGEDLLLLIMVGESAFEKLVETVSMDDKMDPDEFQVVKYLVQFIGNELKMVRITEREVNTYYARIYLGKPGEMPIIDLDAQPSDAINLATRLKAPIYDVLLDSAPDGPDTLLEEIDLLEKMEKAVRDERYKDAAMWRDRLFELRRAT